MYPDIAPGVSVYVVPDVPGFTVYAPEVPEPDKLPGLIVHVAEALLVDTAKFAVCAVWFTVTEALAVPGLPPLEDGQDIEYVVVVAGETDTEPEVGPGFGYVGINQPVHELALVDDQVSVLELPEFIVVGEAVRVAVAFTGFG